MCDFRVEIQKKVFAESTATKTQKRKIAVKRLQRCGVLTGKGKLTSQYKFIGAYK